MKVKVTYQETWNRTAEVDVDEEEIREWASIPAGEPIPGDKIREFLDATDYDGMGEPAPWVSGVGPDNGISGCNDEYDGTDLGDVEVIEDVLAFATVNSFLGVTAPMLHVPKPGVSYVDSDTPVTMACGVEIVIPDRPKVVPYSHVHHTCRLLHERDERLLARESVNA